MIEYNHNKLAKIYYKDKIFRNKISNFKQKLQRKK